MAKGDERKPRADASGPEGRRDEVDASKGIFPADAPHPEGAERRMAGEIGGGPYEESGRSGPGLVGTEPAPAGEERQRARGPDGERTERPSRARADERPSRSRADEEEPKGELPPHRPSAQSAS